MSDLIDRQAAIEALKNDMASLDHIIKGMSANDVRLDAYVSQRNQVNYDIYTINNLPPVQPEQLGTNLAEVGTDYISRQAAIDAVNRLSLGETDATRLAMRIWDYLERLPSAQPETAMVTIGRAKGGVTMWFECDACGEPIDICDCYCRKCGRKLKHE